MKKILFLLSTAVLSSYTYAQNVTVFENVPFYSMYHYLGEGEQLPQEAYDQIPEDAIRIHQYERDIISRKLTETEINSLEKNLTVNATIIAACDNYDRIAGVNLALVPKGRTTYTWEDTAIKRIEIGRFITPFMNKNYSPTQVPFSFRVDHLVNLFNDPNFRNTYDFWIEFRADGYSAAANTQVAGCTNRTDVFRRNLNFNSNGGTITNNPSQEFIPLKYRDYLNKYNSTDVAGQTTRIVNFTVENEIENAKLYLSMSNHGANSGGEEYVRRNHYVYLDDELLLQYKPGGNSCEPFRQFNTQGNGIYGTTPKTLRNWISWSNWCPADKIPNREIDLGTLSPGEHSIKIDVPEAVFVNNEGYFPISMYIQNSPSNQEFCAAPNNLSISDHVGQNLTVNWTENGNATNWEVLAGRRGNYNESYDSYHLASGEPKVDLTNLTVSYNFYEFYVRSLCGENNKSEWIGPLYSGRITLSIDEMEKNGLTIYPNPVIDIVNIESQVNPKEVEIINIGGKSIWKGNSKTISFKTLPAGVYILKVEFEDGKKVQQKLIKK